MGEIEKATLAYPEEKASSEEEDPKIELVREETVIPSLVGLNDPFDETFKITVYIENFTGTVFAGYGVESRRKLIRLAEEPVDLKERAANLIITWKPPPPTTRDILEWWLDAFKEDYIPEETSTIRLYVLCGDKVEEKYWVSDYQLYEVMVEVPEIPWEKILIAGALCVGAGAVLYGITR